LSLVGGAVAASLMLVMPSGVVVRAVVAGMGLAYILYRLHRSREHTGRIVVIGAWCAIAAAAWLLAIPLPAYLAIHAGMIWLIRSLYTHSNLRAAAADLGLCALGLAFAVWAALRAESLFLAAWCFFLLQALHVAIPAWTAERAREDDPRVREDDAFAGAHRAAERALRELAAGCRTYR
jgi:hypothetical protein